MAADRARVLLLVPTSTYRAHDFLAAARKMNVQVTVGSNERQALEDLAPGSTLTLDFGNVDAAVRAIVEFADTYPLRAVIGADDETTEMGARAAGALGLRHNTVESVAATRNKGVLRKVLERAGLPSPQFRLVSTRHDARVVAREFDYPCVLKPTFLAASRGVIRADDPAQFVAAHRRIAAILEDPDLRRSGGAEAEHILVEDYISGTEFAVEAMLDDGHLFVLALFDKPDPLEGPFFEETIYVTPSRASDSMQRQIVETVERAVVSIGIREGPAHAEVRVNDSGVYLIDLAARAIGGLCPRVLRFGTGMSLEELILYHATGRDFSAFEREPDAAGVMMIPIPRAGVLNEVAGLEGAATVDGIDAITISINRGQPLVPLPEGDRYLGFIFARGDDPATVEAALREAHRRLEIDIEPA